MRMRKQVGGLFRLSDRTKKIVFVQLHMDLSIHSCQFVETTCLRTLKRIGALTVFWSVSVVC